ncbi:hypothetical protein E5K00_16055 [Hymenobacter aquaticus]|uniref:Outer membrane protein beta-barrel domain-containing protein n=1 Tax=Hymenobacter aquaticus TaxID=1867101 RepID=A0A4Z0PWT1_9BACT|nr:hypothetical protein [Hymenobacter aquaticus]TGE21779.1 hypothetical protein E5K00_16055 [Hymenobacter aquaticus]
MKTLVTTLLFAALTSASAVAQTKAPARAVKPASPGTAPTTRPATTKTATTTKSVAKPAAKPVAKAPTTAKPTPAPAPAPVTAAAPAPAAPEKAPATPAAAGELFQKGSTVANLGIGVGIGYGYYGTVKSTPAMSLSVEHGIKEGVGPGTIGIGGLVGYKAYHYDYPGTSYKSKWTNIIVSARGTYHYNVLQNPKLDTYGGISLGVRIQKWTDSYYDDVPELRGYNTSMAYLTTGIFVGARYYFTDNIGAFTELGYDMNYLKVGLSARF